MPIMTIFIQSFTTRTDGVRKSSRLLFQISFLLTLALPIILAAMQPDEVVAQTAKTDSTNNKNNHITATDIFSPDVVSKLMYNYRVDSDVPLIKQSKKMGCWATTGAMMAGWKSKKFVGIDDYIGILGDKYRRLYNNDSGIQRNQMQGYMIASGLEFEWGASYTTNGLQNLLQKFGPLCFTVVDSSGLSDHATLVIGLIGTGGMESTYIIYIDPIDGKEHKSLYPKFMNDYEKVAFRMNQDGIFEEGYQLIHYPQRTKPKSF